MTKKTTTSDEENNMITITISTENYKILQSLAVPFEDKEPNDVLTRVLREGGIQPAKERLDSADLVSRTRQSHMKNLTQGHHSKTNNKSQLHRQHTRSWAPAIMSTLENMGAMTYESICTHLEQEWERYFTKPPTTEELEIVNIANRGDMPRWQEKVRTSLNNLIRRNKIVQANGRYFTNFSGGSVNVDTSKPQKEGSTI